MNKKRTRKALIKEIKRLVFENSMLNVRLEQEKERSEKEISKLGYKLDLLGSSLNTPVVNGKHLCTVTVETQIYGTYEILPDEMPVDQFEKLKQSLAVSMVNDLMKNHLIQFIHKPKGSSADPLMPGTIAAKIFVVPWDQTVPKTQTMTLIQEDS